MEQPSQIPDLQNEPGAPLQRIASALIARQPDIEAWFRGQWLATPAPFYASIDLRNAGFKLAPVDTNLFPGGFNNLNPAHVPLAVQAIQSAMEKWMPDAMRILLVPENHTRNLYYLESVATLRDIIAKAGYEVRVGSLIPDLGEAVSIDLPSGNALRLEPLVRDGDRVGVGDFFPCCILLNNDLSGGQPDVLRGLRQTVIPPLGLGWNTRSKSDHFAHYRDVAGEFAERLDIDPWLIDPMFRNCSRINFMDREGEDCLARETEKLLADIQAKYDQYGVTSKPFVMVKADSGTHGMAVMPVQHRDEIRALNRKQRTRMASTKGGQSVDAVILQEGVYTRETWGDAAQVAEPVLYMIDHFTVGGFYRIHAGKREDENLNSPGMEFRPLPFSEVCCTPEPRLAPDTQPNRLYAYGVIARLALLAAAREIHELASGP